MNRFLLLFLLISNVSIAQKPITVESIWKDYEFNTKSVPGFNFLNDGRHYTRLEDNVIKKYDITSGGWVADIFNAQSITGQLGFEGEIDDYHFNADESMILIESESESIYRRSYLAKYHIYDFRSGQLHALYEEGKVMNATFSPDSKYVAYVYENNLYYYNLESQETLPITFDGQKNSIINGLTDWVYEEEFSLVKAFWWSPDSKKIAYIRFDESDVPEFNMTYYTDQAYPEYETFKYPKVGEKNAEVSAHMYDIRTEENSNINVGDLTDAYIPRVKWTQDPNVVCIFKMNRHQNHLQLYLSNADDGSSKVLLEEKNQYYVDIHDHLTFLKNGKHFIWTSEKEGYNHIYKYDMDGKELCAITKGNFDVTEFYGVDEENDLIFYQAAENSPLQREIYQINTKGNKKKLLTPLGGTNNAEFSSTYDYYTLNRSTINTPATYAVYNRKGEMIRLLEDNATILQKIKDYGVQPLEFFSFNTSENVQLNGWMIKPKDFKEDGNYPVFMFQYSGPGSQQVLDSWRGSNYWWFQMLAQKGYLIACVDGRGTGGRGEEFKKMTYQQLGHYETIDQIEAAQHLGRLPYTDSSRIGIFGWSYGGYMSSLCILKGNDVFSTAIAVAPVTNWKWYDSIYTERYMRTSQENPDGYRNNSPVYFADKLKGQYLLVHGGADDNVHLQNSMEMANALINANKQYDTYIYPNKNHGIYGGNTRLHLYTKMTNFLDENLMGKKIVD
jgi:dipeptidyl-peptidase 4